MPRTAWPARSAGPAGKPRRTSRPVSRTMSPCRTSTESPAARAPCPRRTRCSRSSTGVPSDARTAPTNLCIPWPTKAARPSRQGALAVPAAACQRRRMAGRGIGACKGMLWTGAPDYISGCCKPHADFGIRHPRIRTSAIRMESVNCPDPIAPRCAKSGEPVYKFRTASTETGSRPCVQAAANLGAVATLISRPHGRCHPMSILAARHGRQVPNEPAVSHSGRSARRRVQVHDGRGTSLSEAVPSG